MKHSQQRCCEHPLIVDNFWEVDTSVFKRYLKWTPVIGGIWLYLLHAPPRSIVVESLIGGFWLCWKPKGPPSNTLSHFFLFTPTSRQVFRL
ncbi:hypothetical protein ABKN59_003316 [Abortiporus biennis]